jgi:hypothetical protein
MHEAKASEAEKSLHFPKILSFAFWPALRDFYGVLLP